VVVAIVCEAVLRIGRRAVRAPAHLAIAAAAFTAIYFAGVPFPLVVVVAALTGWLGSRVRPSAFTASTGSSRPAEAVEGSEVTLVIDDSSPPAAHTLPSMARFARTLVVGVGLWVGGWFALVGWRGIESLHAQQYAFFTKAAFVTFGGAYAVLAYVAQAAVDSFGWLTRAQIVDGLALAETTPGPLIMVVQFVGFVGAWNDPEGLTPWSSGVVGALATTFVTFLPCFLFIFLGAPYIETLRARPTIGASLAAVTAAVVGVILNLALVFGATVLLPGGPAGGVDWMAAIVAAVAFVALWRLRVDVLWVVLCGGLLGLLVELL
jgi:chromate transporter